MKKPAKPRTPVVAAGGIVIRASPQPLIAVVRLRKDKSWVLPKGKLKPGEDAPTAARREVTEETGCDVSVEGFLGSMSHFDGKKLRSCSSGGWAASHSTHELMDDVTAVQWLPLQQAVDILTRPHERAFLTSMGKAALQAAEPLVRETHGDRSAPSVPAVVSRRNSFFEAIRAWFLRW